MSRILFLAVVSAALAACNSESVSGIGGLVFEASAAVVAPPAKNVTVTVKISNISSAPIVVDYGGCAVTPVFHSGSATGAVVYDPRPTQTCEGGALSKTLDPDKSFTITGNATPSLATGTYFVEAVVAVNGETTSVPAGMVTF